MSYIGAGFLTFFRGLGRQNTREWFHAHKQDYELHVKAPFEEFVEELIHRIGALDPAIRGVLPREAIFRLARDTRFSRDKTPYKRFVSAVIAPGGRKHLSEPGLFFRMGADGLAIAGGLYKPTRDQLTAIRWAIARDGRSLRRLVAARSFRSLYGELAGDRNKRLAPEFAAAAHKEPLLYHKQFYYWAEYNDPKVVLRRDLAEYVIRHWKAGRSVNDWLAAAATRPAPAR